MIDVFISFPYAHPNTDVIRRRVQAAEEYTAKLIREGKVVYSTIIANESLVYKFGIPFDYSYWKEHCQKFVSVSSEVHVLCFDRWEESIGVKDEIETATKLGIPVIYLSEEILVDKLKNW
jgi:hypothetical protein